jgi:ribosomal protein S18 acetylase RimI-like enzyme
MVEPISPRLGATPATVRTMTPEDVAVVAHLHVAHFPRNVAVRFGSRFVEAYVRLFLDSPFAVGLVATEREHVVGYLLGVSSTTEHRAFSKRRLTGLSVAALPQVIPNLTFLVKVATRRVRNRRSHDDSGPASPGPIAVLSHIAVLEEARSCGTGATLVRNFEDAAVSRGARTAFLATVDCEDGAGDFYDRQGWVASSRGTTVDQRSLRIFKKTFSSSSSPTATPIGPKPRLTDAVER